VKPEHFPGGTKLECKNLICFSVLLETQKESNLFMKSLKNEVDALGPSDEHVRIFPFNSATKSRVVPWG
jgi:hypothetical protein